MRRNEVKAYQYGPEDCGADSIRNLKLSFLIGSREVMITPRTKHPIEKGESGSDQYRVLLYLYAVSIIGK